MNVFADLHHEGLYDSFKMLFEDRLGGKLFRPVGLEWFQEGFWKIAELYNNAPDTIGQFLELRDIKEYPFIPPFSDKSLNEIKEQTKDYYVMNVGTGQKAITLEQFKNMDIDIVIASIPAHFVAYAELIKKYKPNAKLICHYGNNWLMSNYQQDNVMASILPQPIPNNTNVVFYHQEFDLNIFKYKEPTISKHIKSFVHVFDGYPDAQLFYDVEKLMPDYSFKVHGATSRDGNINGYQNIADAMHDSMFIWHLKKDGDGFGHIIHNAFACGRPPIVKKEYYKDQLAEQLMEDGVTCIAVDNLNPQEIVDKIRKYSETDNYIKLCQNAYNRFKEFVDYDEEEKEIREFVDNLI